MFTNAGGSESVPVPSYGVIAGTQSTPVERDFFDRPVLEVAPDLLGCVLIRRTDDGPTALRLTEVEAYAGPADPGSHAYRGRTERNAVMFGPPGHAYVYFTYGMWHCVNLVCGPVGRAAGVLLRGGEIIDGVEFARERRPTSRRLHDLARGPARLATALGIDRALNGSDVCGGDAATSPLSLLRGTPPRSGAVRTGPRTGVGGEGAAHPWRYWIAGDPTVSPYRSHSPRRRENG